MLHDQTELPTGTVTFLFTDIEGSTVRWESAPEQMRSALARHDTIMREAIAQSGGVLFQTAGDSFVTAFASARPALDMALAVQSSLRDETWPVEIGAIRVRMALHTGTATRQEHGYEANHALTRQARLLSTAHAEQILVSGITRELLAPELPDGVELRDLGELRLKNLVDPQRVFQVVASKPPWSLPDSFPPPLGQREHPGNLPAAPLPFIGRTSTVAEVSNLVIGGPTRLVTLLGPGGIGKTRLALRTAERVQHHFGDGAFFVDLAAITDVELVVPAIGSALGLTETDVSSLADYLRDRNVLLVLDNLEQVIDSADGVAALLAAAPDVRVLATSRIPLRLLSEREYLVAPLALPDLGPSSHDVDEVGQVDAVALFVERAKAARPDFELAADNVAAVAGICRRLDGIPLALLLAAPRLKLLTPTEMLERLDERLALLTDGARDLPSRHQTLRDTIEWSYGLLDEHQRARYAHWSIFAGGFGLQAAHALDPLGGGDLAETLDAVRSLVDNNLLVAVQASDGEPRYSMLETINEHGRGKLDQSDERERAEQARTRFYLGMAEEAAPHLEGELLVLWTGRLEDEHDNFRAALAHGFERAEATEGSLVEATVRLATALSLFWHDRGYMNEGRRNMEAALELVPVWKGRATNDNERRQAVACSAVLLDYLGSLVKRKGDWPQSRQLLEQALATYQSIDDQRGQGRVLAVLGSLSLMEGDVEGARDAHMRSIEFARSSGDDFTAVNGLLSTGNIERDTGSRDRAVALYQGAFDAATKIHDLVGVSVALNNLANLFIEAGDLDRARTLHLDGLRVRHEVNHRIMVAESMVGLAAIEVAIGQPARAARLLGFAVGLADEVDAGFDLHEERLFDRTMATLRSDRGEAWVLDECEIGRAMTLEAAMALAYSAAPAAPDRKDPAPPQTSEPSSSS